MTFLAPALMWARASSSVRRILFGEHLNLVAIDDEEVAFERHVVVELAVHGVVLEHVGEVVNVEKVVDTDNLDVVCEVFHGGAEHHTADAAETIDTEFESHYWILLFIVELLATFRVVLCWRQRYKKQGSLCSRKMKKRFFSPRAPPKTALDRQGRFGTSEGPG